MSQVLLTIAIPAYNRPEWLRRSLQSIIDSPVQIHNQVEIIVSDDSTIEECGAVFTDCIRSWKGQSYYEHNYPSVGMAGNWNHCIRLATGRYILILHDDDYLTFNGVENILKVLKQYAEYSAFLFGVNVVNDRGKIKKRQHFRRDTYLSPEKALVQVLSNSSFVRFPGIVLERSLFEEIGYFDEAIGEISDIDRWIRVFHSSGVFCASPVTANYTVHINALTMNMFNENIINKLCKLFDWVKSQNWLDKRKIESCKANYFYQFILAGTIRYLRNKKVRDAEKIFNLFNSLNLDYKILLNYKIFIRFVLSTFFRIYNLQ